MISLLIVVIALGIILEIISLRRDPEKVEFDYAISERVTEPGAAFNIQAAITNKSRVPISYLAIKEILPFMAKLPDGMSYQEKKDGYHTENVCRLKGRQRKRLIMETSIEKRGVHTFKGNSIEFGDFLGFREFTMHVMNHQEIVVYPGRVDNPDLTEALASFHGDIAAKRFLIRDPILSAGCREYTGREPMKDIHWLQSARRAELIVREYEYNRQLSVSVILGVEDGGGHTDDGWLDDCCAIARTVCENLLEKGVPVNFFTNAILRRISKKQIWKCEVSAGYTGELLEGLGRISTFTGTSLDRLLEFAHRENDSDAAFIIILPAANKSGDGIADRIRRATGREVLLLQGVGS